MGSINSGIGIHGRFQSQNYLFKNKEELQLLNLELKFVTKPLNPQINLPFNSETFLP